MAIWSFTQERLDRLKEQIAKKKQEHDELEALSEKDLWCQDLDEFEAEWEAQLVLDQQIKSNIRKMGRRVSKKIGAGRGRKTRRRASSQGGRPRREAAGHGEVRRRRHLRDEGDRRRPRRRGRAGEGPRTKASPPHLTRPTTHTPTLEKYSAPCRRSLFHGG